MERKDMPISLMVATLEGSPLLDKMEMEWETLANELDVPAAFVEGIRSDVLFHSANSQKVLTDILLNWRLRCGSKANFTSLIKIIEERCHWINIGEQMQRNKDSCVTLEITQQTKWKDLPPCKQGELCTKEVRIFGVKRSLMSFAKGIIGNGLRSILNDTFNKEELHNFVNTVDYELTRSTIPDALCYYVERKVSIRNKINLNSISSKDTDIFAVEGIDRKTFDMITRSHLVMSSSPGSNVSQRFILLESSNQFQQLCQKTASTIHYLRFQMGSFIWVKTFGNIEKMLKFKESSVFINEDSFIKVHLTKHLPCVLCVTGSSGDGKTTFLANVARKLQKYHEERVVIFITFRYLIANINLGLGQELCSTEIIRVIASFVSTNDIGRSIISNILVNSNYQIEIFLDGYEELLTSEGVVADMILACFVNEFKNCRLFMTANENQCKELGEKFGVISWELGEFQNNDQIKLLNLYWSSSTGIQITNKLFCVSKSCVNLLASSDNLHTIQFVGIPMLTAMLAHEFGDFIRDFLQGTFKTLDVRRYIVTNSFLYQSCFKQIFEKVSSDTRQYVIQFALETTFPKFLPDILLVNTPFHFELTKGLHSHSLLQKSCIPNKVEFVHKSFAEYLSIQYLFDQIRDFDVERGVKTCSQILSFLFETTNNSENQVTFVNLRLCFVFEAFLLDQLELKKEIARFVYEHVSNEVKHLNKIFLACLNNELYGILCLLIRGVRKSARKVITESPSLSAVGHNKLLRILDVASRHVSIKMARKIHESLEISTSDISKLNLYSWKPLGILMTSMHFASKQGNMRLFDYFLNSINLIYEQELPTFLCHAAVYNSKYDLPHIVESKLEIITKLVAITNGKILQEKSENIPLVQLLTNIHIRLLKRLIESGVDLFAVDSQQNTLAHQITEYMAADEYHDLVEILLSRDAGSLFRKTNKKKETAFSKALRVMKLEDKTIHLLLTSKELVIERVTCSEETNVYQLIRAGYGSEVLATALEYSSDWKQGYFIERSTSLLHVAVLYQNVEAVEYFLDVVRISANARDEFGMTPYHVACSGESLCYTGTYTKSLNIINLLIKHGADVRLTDNSGRLPLSYLLGNINI